MTTLETTPLELPAATAAAGCLLDATSERQIWQAAIMLVREHGDEAATFAGEEALKHRDGTDHLRYFVWAWITRVTANLIRPEPDPGEYRH